ncbi:hypothetical protein RHMOL_Rhmol13G0104200 [Rhododendron molle]|nr:hypothetical protein RHMOL_Rhmol13G0104200 [Rhododendron molle]
MYLQQTSEDNIDERVSFLYSAWSALLDESTKGEGELLQGADQVRRSNNNVLKAPHLEDCKLSAQLNKKLNKLSSLDALEGTLRYFQFQFSRLSYHFAL